MGEPSWVELVGRNAAAEVVWVSGVLRITEPVEEFGFWHGPGGRWRIEHVGEVIYLCAAGQKPLLRRDGEMRALGGDLRVATFGTPVSPLELLGDSSLLRGMAAGLVVARAPQRVDPQGRPAWSTILAGPSGDTGEIWIDDATGLIVRMSAPSTAGVLEVTGLADHDTLPDELFRWEGPIVADETGGPHEIGRARVEILSALVAALDRPREVLDVLTRIDDDAAARAALTELLGATDDGVDAVLAMQLRRFRPHEADTVRAELRAAGRHD
ncbi:MAG: hypothetical protein QM662_10750 [Gordonia sp. (in: high G+C Gram-positive bacteria)]